MDVKKHVEKTEYFNDRVKKILGEKKILTEDEIVNMLK